MPAYMDTRRVKIELVLQKWDEDLERCISKSSHPSLYHCPSIYLSSLYQKHQATFHPIFSYLTLSTYLCLYPSDAHIITSKPLFLRLSQPNPPQKLEDIQNCLIMTQDDLLTPQSSILSAPIPSTLELTPGIHPAIHVLLHPFLTPFQHIPFPLYFNCIISHPSRLSLPLPPWIRLWLSKQSPFLDSPSWNWSNRPSPFANLYLAL